MSKGHLTQDVCLGGGLCIALGQVQGGSVSGSLLQDDHLHHQGNQTDPSPQQS